MPLTMISVCVGVSIVMPFGHRVARPGARSRASGSASCPARPRGNRRRRARACAHSPSVTPVHHVRELRAHRAGRVRLATVLRGAARLSRPAVDLDARRLGVHVQRERALAPLIVTVCRRDRRGHALRQARLAFWLLCDMACNSLQFQRALRHDAQHFAAVPGRARLRDRSSRRLRRRHDRTAHTAEDVRQLVLARL